MCQLTCAIACTWLLIGLALGVGLVMIRENFLELTLCLHHTFQFCSSKTGCDIVEHQDISSYTRPYCSPAVCEFDREP